MKKIIIVGAGAIGRGFLPWVLHAGAYELVFIDTNRNIIARMQKRSRFGTYRVKGNGLEKIDVLVKEACLPECFKANEHTDAELIFINVGPRNCVDAAKLVENIKVPVVLCENDPFCVDLVKRHTKIEKCFFAIPDVITSNSASPAALEEDALSVVTEDGILYIDDRVGEVKINCVLCNQEELDKQWIAKLYLHNTPHCVAAYHGALVGFKYLHEVMQYPILKNIVAGSMREMLRALKLKWEIAHDFLDWYADKEIARFSSQLLFDPIARVAREPMRKLEVEGRLIGAAQICLSHGIIPENILLGIGCALLSQQDLDPDKHLRFMRKYIKEDVFSTYILGLRKGEALEVILNNHLSDIVDRLHFIEREMEGVEHA